jgi:hypothetical protein
MTAAVPPRKTNQSLISDTRLAAVQLEEPIEETKAGAVRQRERCGQVDHVPHEAFHRLVFGVLKVYRRAKERFDFAGLFRPIHNRRVADYDPATALGEQAVQGRNGESGSTSPLLVPHRGEQGAAGHDEGHHAQGDPGGV